MFCVLEGLNIYFLFALINIFLFKYILVLAIIIYLQVVINICFAVFYKVD